MHTRCHRLAINLPIYCTSKMTTLKRFSAVPLLPHSDRIENQIKETGEKAEKKRSEIVKIQGDYQQLMASQQQQAQSQAA